MEVTIIPINGVPVMHIDGKPDSAEMYWRRTIPAHDAKMFGESGVNLFSFNNQLWIGDAPDGSPAEYKDCMYPYAPGSPEHIDAAMEEILSGNPRALVMPRFRVIAPTWWVEQHPEEMMRLYDIRQEKMKTGVLPAVDSEKWLCAARKGIEDTVRYCEEKWGDHILAYHTGMGCCAEHSYDWGPYIADYSLPHLIHFRKWLFEKYGTDDALRAAWKRPDVTFETAEFPAPERYLADRMKFNVFFSPEKDADLIDHQLFNSVAMAEGIVFQAKAVKDTLRGLGHQKLFCAFYGYHHMDSSMYSKYAHGHDGQDIVLNCDDIDILCAPLSYSARQAGGCANAQLLPGSVTLHGKIYYAEDDTGTHKAHSDCWGHVPRTADEAASLLRRNFLATFSTGGNQWWMDLLSQDWYSDPTIMAEVAWQRKFAESHFLDTNTPLKRWKNNSSDIKTWRKLLPGQCIIEPRWRAGGKTICGQGERANDPFPLSAPFSLSPS